MKLLIMGDKPCVSMNFTQANKLAKHLTANDEDGWIFHVHQNHNQKYHIYVTDPADGDYLVGWM